MSGKHVDRGATERLDDEDLAEHEAEEDAEASESIRSSEPDTDEDGGDAEEADSGDDDDDREPSTPPPPIQLPDRATRGKRLRQVRRQSAVASPPLAPVARTLSRAPRRVPSRT
jgi:hypothetical protein